MDELCPQLLDLIPKDREWLVETESSRNHGGVVSEEKKLELRLGPPGVEDWTKTNKAKGKGKDHESLLSLSHLPSSWMNDNGGNLCKSKSNNGSPSLPQQIGVETLLKKGLLLSYFSGAVIKDIVDQVKRPQGLSSTLIQNLSTVIKIFNLLGFLGAR